MKKAHKISLNYFLKINPQIFQIDITFVQPLKF
jgi:hypothetical protein